MPKLLLLLLIFIGFPFKSRCQDVSAIWKEGKALAEMGNWEACRTLIQPHLFPPSSDSLMPKLGLLYAISCEKLGDHTSALVSAERLANQNVEKIIQAESHFLAGRLRWKSGKYTLACQHFFQLPGSYEEEVASFVSSDDAIPADSLDFIKIQWQPNVPTWFSSLELRNKKESKRKQKPRIPQVAVVFPFLVSNKKNAKSDAALFDYYRGMLMAAEVLAAVDSNVEVHAFDSENKTEKLNKILNDKSLEGVDLIIGPVKGDHTDLIHKTRSLQKIPLIIPLQNQRTEIMDSYRINQQSSAQTIAEQAFQFCSQHSTGQKVGIVFGTEKSDSLLAKAYVDYAQKMGRKVVLMKKVGKNSAANLTKFLVESGLDSTDHLFVPNNETLVRVQLMSAYSWIKGKFPILVYGRWLESSNADYEEFSQHPIYFMNPDLANRRHSQWHIWERSYLTKWGRPPGWAAWKGFDLLMTFARSWYESGSGWFTSWQSGEPVPSPLFGHYQFRKDHGDNSYLPIYSIGNEGIVQIFPK